MSLVINTTTPEGIVLAADSRQSYRNLKGMARIGSDNALKLFQINSRIGVGITGLAFLAEEGVLKNLSKFIEEFKRGSDIEELDVEDVAEELHQLFDEKYQWEGQLDLAMENIKNDLQIKGCQLLNMEKNPYNIKFSFKNPQGNLEEGLAGVDMIELLVAGYNKDGTHQVYGCYIPGEIQKRRDSEDQNNEYGSSWIGQGDVVSRIVLGFDGRIANVQFAKEAVLLQGEANIFEQLKNLEYAIQWGTMTLQDGIDFCTLMIQTTSAMQRFSDGINADPGDMPGVGGPIDVAVITPDNGFVWISKKKLKFGSNEVDLG
jgi:20S proteasome alpha/beta subunit